MFKKEEKMNYNQSYRGKKMTLILGRVSESTLATDSRDLKNGGLRSSVAVREKESVTFVVFSM